MSVMVQLDREYVEAEMVRDRPTLFQVQLSNAKAHSNAKCFCNPDKPINMVVRKLITGYILASWPGSLESNRPFCPVLGVAAVKHAASDMNEQDESLEQVQIVYRDGWFSDTDIRAFLPGPCEQVTIDWLLGEIWQSSQLSSWRQGWTRDWAFVTERILKASKHQHVNGAALSEHLYVVETFSQKRKNAINKAWDDFIGKLEEQPFRYSMEEGQGGFRTGLVLGELTSAQRSQGTWVLKLKNHYADFGLVPEAVQAIDPRLASKLQQLSIAEEEKPVVLLCIAIDDLGLLHVLDMSLMEVGRYWLPATLKIEKELLEVLLASKFDLHVTKSHKWGGEEPFVVIRKGEGRHWERLFTYPDSMNALKLQQYRTKLNLDERKFGRINKLVGYADHINKVVVSQ